MVVITLLNLFMYRNLRDNVLKIDKKLDDKFARKKEKVLIKAS